VAGKDKCYEIVAMTLLFCGGRVTKLWRWSS